MTLQNIALGIFDHSGVLSDDRLPVYEANMRLFERYGLRRITFEEWIRGSQASAGDVLIHFGVRVERDVVNAQYKWIYEGIVAGENPIQPKMYEGVPEVLEGLTDKGLRLAIVSTHPQSSLENELRQYGIAEFFDMVSGDPASKTKRLQAICAGAGILPERAFFIGDTIFDLTAGKQAGVNCFAVTTGYHSRERLEGQGAIAVMDSLEEIFKHI